MAQGYHGTGIGQVLKALGVPKGSFYNFFESKEAFVAELIDRYSERLLTVFDRQQATFEGSALEGLRLAWRFLIAAHSAGRFEDGCLVANLAGEVGQGSPLCHSALSRALDGVRARLEATIARGQREGDLRTDHPAGELADFVWDAWEGSLLRAKVERSPRPLDRTVAFLFDDFLIARARPAPALETS